MAINWGPVSGSGNSQGCLGIETIYTNDTATQITVINYVYYWTRYAVSDSGNSFYVDWDTYADTYIGSKKINHTVNNVSWSESNITCIGSWQSTFNKTASEQTGYFSARFADIEYGGGSGTHYISFTVPALTRYTVTYNGNGGSGSMDTDTILYGYPYRTKSNEFVKEGHTWVGWNEKADGTGPDWTNYVDVDWIWSYTKSITLYAIWEVDTYTISYNATGGSGAPASQTKTYGKDLVLSSVVPSKKGCKFVCWNTKEDGSGESYDPGSTCEVNKSIVLYAIWKKVENMAINKNGAWKKGISCMEGKKGTPYINVKGVWKKGGA